MSRKLTRARISLRIKPAIFSSPAGEANRVEHANSLRDGKRGVFGNRSAADAHRQRRWLKPLPLQSGHTVGEMRASKARPLLRSSYPSPVGQICDRSFSTRSCTHKRRSEAQAFLRAKEERVLRFLGKLGKGLLRREARLTPERLHNITQVVAHVESTGTDLAR